jgi:hypothetical protein
MDGSGRLDSSKAVCNNAVLSDSAAQRSTALPAKRDRVDSSESSCYDVNQSQQ